MKKIAMIALIAVVAGCAAPPKYTIKSSSPAYIEIDGVVVCKSTPCEVNPPYYVHGFGDCAKGVSMQSVLVAFPIDKARGFVQQKQIRAMCDDDKTVFFDMEATSAIRTTP